MAMQKISTQLAVLVMCSLSLVAASQAQEVTSFDELSLALSGSYYAPDVCCFDNYTASAPGSTEKKKSVGLAILFEYLVPTLGHAYAKNWKRGLLPNAVRVTGLILSFNGLILVDCLDDTDCSYDSGTFEAGLVMLAVGTVWAMVRAGNTAKAYNEANRLALNVGLKPNGVALAVRF